MEPLVPNKKLEPGVFQGTPEAPRGTIPSPKPARLIRTMKSDMAEAVKTQNETSVSIALAEEKKKAALRAEEAAAQQAQPQKVNPAPKPIGRIVVIIIILLIIASLGLAYVFVLPKLGALQFQLPKISLPSFSKPASLPVTATPIIPLAKALIPAQSEKRFDISKEILPQILATISNEKEGIILSGSIKNLYFTEMIGATSTEISANRLLSFANVQTPDLLTRSLDKQFMTGFIGDANSTSVPFLILKVSDHNTGLAGMLAWEQTLPKDFDTLFGTTIASVPNAKFRDIIVLGKDARSFESTMGTLAYAFADQNTIIIAGSRSALETLLPIATKN